MANLYYVNSNNEKLDLSAFRIRVKIKQSGLYNNEWTIRSKERSSGLGVSVVRFEKNPREINMTIDFTGAPEERADAMNRFFEVTEIDVLKKKTGKLYKGNQYIEGYFIKADAGFYDDNTRKLKKDVVFYAPYPFWIEEKKIEYRPIDEEARTSDYLDYPYDYAYDYSGDTRSFNTITNDHFAESSFKMVIYGPCTNPSIRIAGNTHQVNATLTEREYLVIDSINETVIRYRANGSAVNEFNNRYKIDNIFKPIPSGVSQMVCGQGFSFDIVLKQERGELKWN